MNSRISLDRSPDSGAHVHGSASSAASSALLFPGQGSQTDDMRNVVVEHRPDLLEQAVEKLGADPFGQIGVGTIFAQPALYCAAIAYWERSGRPAAAAMAGHSLGELASLVAAGSLDDRAGLSLAVERGRLMQAAADRSPGGGMMAVLGADDAAEALAADHGLAVANYNAPGQLVLSGEGSDLDAAAGVARERRLRAIRLPVTGAFHSPAMATALPAFRDVLDSFEFSSPSVPVLSCTTAEPFDDIRATLAEALVRPVRWRELLQALQKRGISRFVETGPGKVLTGLAKRTLEGVEATTLEPAHA